ncbi:MAG: acetate/propionate family kinase [Gammaproteobacteria bacterium]
MSESILTLNAGSSSLKFALFEPDGDTPLEQARGQIEGLGANARMVIADPHGAVLKEEHWSPEAGPHSAQEALIHVLAWFEATYPRLRALAVGHRIVHGGPDHAAPLALDDRVIAALKQLSPLAPLHQPHNLTGVEAARAAFPEALQVGCFDTAFHRAHPWVNDVFAIPRQLYDEGVRRYGFHGLSYEYVTRELARIAPQHAAGRVVVAHLGNGASMCAVRNGHSVGSTMGFSALDGLPMGTRTGQIDPGVLLYLLQDKGMSPDELSQMLYYQSGLKGLSGISHDMRALEGSYAPEAAQAIDYFVFRIRRELGAMAAILGGIDALVFCGGIGGIGENAHRVRERVASGFEWLGIELDHHRNRMSETVVSSDRSRCRVFVVKTDEERMIAEHTLSLLRSHARSDSLAEDAA